MPEQEIDQSGLAAAFEAANSGTTAIVDTPPVDAPPIDTPPADAPPPVDTATPAPTTFNPSDWLKTSTDGLIDTEEKFKEFIPKIKNYDDLETKLKAAEASKVEFKNDETKALYEAWASGNKEAVVNYIKETTKDFTTMSDLDIVREAISKEHPEWDAKGIELEVRGKFGKQIEPIDLSAIEEKDEDGKTTQEYRDAIAHNEKAEENALRLKIAARDGRTFLIENQKKIELPQISKAEQAPVSNQPTAEELADRQKAWEKSVDENLPKLSDLKMNINDKEVEYVRTEDEKKELADYMKTFNIFNFAKEQGWTNEDGTPNPLRIAEDRDFLKNKDKIFKSIGTQIETAATKKALAKIKNIPEEVPAGGETDVQPGSLQEALARATAEAGW